MKEVMAMELEHQLVRDRGVHAYRLDGDNIRFGLNKDLGFSALAWKVMLLFLVRLDSGTDCHWVLYSRRHY
jgi:hypothetical protein